MRGEERMTRWIRPSEPRIRVLELCCYASIFEPPRVVVKNINSGSLLKIFELGINYLPENH